MGKKLVYICSPFRGDYERNTENALKYSREAFKSGVIPITPHLYFPRFMDDTNSKERYMAMSAGIQLLEKCDELWAFGLEDPSEGMRYELERATERGIPILDGYEVMKLLKSKRERGGTV